MTRRFVLSVIAVVIGVAAIALAIRIDEFDVALDVDVYGSAPDEPDLAAALPGGEQISYLAADGVELHGWFLAAPGAGRHVTAVVFHGSHSTRAGMAPFAIGLADEGVSVLLAEYRGFGGSGGSPTEHGLHLDATAAIETVRTLAGVDASELVYVGYSLGSGVAVDSAVTDPPAALVLLAPYTSLVDLAWNDHPGLPYRLMMRTQLDSLARIGRVDVPILVVRGSGDQIVPPEQAGELFDEANEPKELVTIDGADHDLVGPDGPTTVEATTSFIRQVMQSDAGDRQGLDQPVLDGLSADDLAPDGVTPDGPAADDPAADPAR